MCFTQKIYETCCRNAFQGLRGHWNSIYSFIFVESLGGLSETEKKSAVVSVNRAVINVCRSTEGNRGRMIEAANDAFSKHESVAMRGRRNVM